MGAPIHIDDISIGPSIKQYTSTALKSKTVVFAYQKQPKTNMADSALTATSCLPFWEEFCEFQPL